MDIRECVLREFFISDIDVGALVIRIDEIFVIGFYISVMLFCVSIKFDVRVIIRYDNLV